MPGPATHLTIPARPDAGAIARRALATWMEGHPRLGDALLATTELINNAVLHGGMQAGEDVTISMKMEGSGIRLTVRHHGLPFEANGPVSLPGDPVAGRGLAIVEQIADRWGVDSNGTEVTAWFEVKPSKHGLDGS